MAEAYRDRERVFAGVMADRADWEAATRAQRHLAIVADIIRYEPVGGRGAPVTEEAAHAFGGIAQQREVFRGDVAIGSSRGAVQPAGNGARRNPQSDHRQGGG